MTSLNTYEGNIQQEHATFEPNEIDKLKEEIHGLKLENETLKIQATSNKGGECQNWQFETRRSQLSKYKLQIKPKIDFFR